MVVIRLSQLIIFFVPDGWLTRSRYQKISSFLQRCGSCGPPLKVVAFSWQLLQGRIPTRENLFKRRVIEDQNATLCFLWSNARNIQSPFCFFWHDHSCLV